MKWKDFLTSGDWLRKIRGQLVEEMHNKDPNRFYEFLDETTDKALKKLPEIVEAYERYQIEQKIKIKNVINELPWNGEWKHRSLDNIYWIIIHQALGKAYKNRSNTAAINKYHITPQFINGKWRYGWAHGAYHYSVDIEVDYVDWCNPWEDITYGAGGGWNKKSLHIVLPGDFSGPKHVGTQEPTTSQLKRLGLICDYLISRKELSNIKDRNAVHILGHFEATGKTNCPGDVIMNWLKQWRNAA